MGTRYLFTCYCGYRVTAAGDYDVGESGSTTTILCRTCKRLYDVTLPTQLPSLDAASQVQPEGCPRGKNHHWRVWTYPGPCPRCGATMKLGEMLSLWD